MPILLSALAVRAEWTESGTGDDGFQMPTAVVCSGLIAETMAASSAH